MAASERERVLGLLEAGRISADQAAALLEAMRDERTRPERPGRPGRPPRPPEAPGPPKPRPPAQLLRIRIDASDGGSDTDATRIHVNVPLALARFAARFLPKEARTELEDQDIDLVELIESLGDEVPDGPLVDIDTHDDGDGKRARIRIEVV